MTRPPFASPPSVLAIAGSDPIGGAGLQADLKTLTALGVFGMGVITAATVQNTTGVRRIEPVDPQLVTDQLDAVLNDVVPTAIKIGMLGTESITHRVADALTSCRVGHVVVDPVIRSSSGAGLLDEVGIEVLLERLFPIAGVVTPNMDEAGRFTGRPVRTVGQMEEAARALGQRGATHVLVTGGHLDGDRVVDVFFDGAEIVHIPGPRHPGPSPHGTGCVLSSAIAAQLSRGRSPSAAVLEAIEFVRSTIRRPLALGRGAPVLDVSRRCRSLGRGDS